MHDLCRDGKLTFQLNRHHCIAKPRPFYGNFGVFEDT